MRNKLLLIIFILCLLIGSGLVYYFSIGENKQEIIEETKEVINEEIIDNNKYQELNEEYKTISDDYVGIVSFESGLIELPFVVPRKSIETYKIFNNYGKVVTDLENGCELGPCTLNDVYLRTDFKTNSYNLGGSIFMDYRNCLSDQNIIIYGHHYSKNDDPTRKLYFTPLELLLDEENYEDNKYVKLYLEDEIRRYELFAVYKFDATSSDDYNNLQYYRTNYEYDYYGNDDSGYYKTYIENVNKVKLYQTDCDLSESDNTLTLQTCVSSTKYIQLLVFKEIDRLNY